MDKGKADSMSYWAQKEGPSSEILVTFGQKFGPPRPSTSPSLRKQRSSKVSIPWSSTIALEACALHPRSSKTVLMLACIVDLFFSFTWSLLLLQEKILYREARVFHIPFLGFQALPKFWSEILVS